jgi:molybdate transport system permease protein
MPGGESGAMRLCVISVVIAMIALVCSEVLAKRFAGRMQG